MFYAHDDLGAWLLADHTLNQGGQDKEDTERE